MKTQALYIAAFSLLAFCTASFAQSNPWPTPRVVDPPPQPDAIPLLPENDGKARTAENWAYSEERGHSVRNVTQPTLTPILPDSAKATGAAVVVAPGGAFMGLALDHEGFRVAQALADRGIAAFVLKYRLLPTPKDEKEASDYIWQKITSGRPDPAKTPALKNPQSTEDALAALRLVRANAAKWGIDPTRVGMIGFSAGAMTSLNTVLAAKPGEGPAFFGYVYGPQAQIDVPADAPPMFDAIALDDPLFPSMGFPIASGWLAAKRPVEIHGYQVGNHGFGLGMPGTTTTLLMDEFTAWLSMQGFLTRKSH